MPRPRRRACSRSSATRPTTCTSCRASAATDARAFPSSPRSCCRWRACRRSSGRTGTTDGYTDFEWPAVERRFDAPAIETPTTEGWAWFELKSSQAPPRGPRCAAPARRVPGPLGQQVREPAARLPRRSSPSQPDQPCARPLLMIQDLGATFGPTKVNIAAWRDMPVWADRRTCTVSMKPLPYQGATFPDARISEAGRRSSRRRCRRCRGIRSRRLFRDARFPEFQSGTDDERDLAGLGVGLRAPGRSDRHRRAVCQ